jgi:hypothetical protein
MFGGSSFGGKGKMNSVALTRATAIGLIAQLAMVIAGHFVPLIKDHGFALGGMTISLVAGLLYARAAAGGWIASLAGGLVAGGVCAVLGIAVSVVLRDVPTLVLAFGTIGSALAGAIGGGVGKLLPAGA